MRFRIDPVDEDAMLAANKCADCCTVVDCDVCGLCPDHDGLGLDEEAS